MSFVDLHLHSDASDGTLNPTRVVQEVARRGAEGVSLTDHDTLVGNEEAGLEADRLGVAWLPGAEISATEAGRSVHLLAYGVREGTEALDTLLAEIREDRQHRAREIVSRFNELGVPVELEAVEREAKAGVPTRAHIARAIVASGLMPNVHSVFQQYLADNGPAYVEKREVLPSTVFSCVHESGGVVVLAHPGREYSDEQIVEWAAAGLDGIEIMHPKNHGSRRDELRAIAYRLDMLTTGGSDWHGPGGGGMDPGTERVPLEWMQAVGARCRPDEKLKVPNDSE
ncbi:MAG: PHP domain-containing protein [Gemmatimonadales bacterium]|nr:MAG: PHP domain-containing protein [Gemmatimonadales bacterium]